MDCDTTGIEPDFALVKFKKLAGGGYFKIVNQSVEAALRKLGYSDEQIEAIEMYAKGTGTLEEAPHINRATLEAKGFDDEAIAQSKRRYPSAFELPFVFNKFVLGEEFCTRNSALPRSSSNDWSFSHPARRARLLAQQIEEASAHICGRMTVEGAPYLKDEHLAVFDCATPCGKYGSRYIRPLAHVDMMAAAQPFVQRRDFQDDQFSADGHDRRSQGSLSLLLGAHDQGRRALSRRLETLAAARRQSTISAADADDEIAARRRHRFTTPMQIAEKIVYRYIAKRRRMPQRRSGYTQKAVDFGGTKSTCAPANTKAAARRDLHRHA